LVPGYSRKKINSNAGIIPTATTYLRIPVAGDSTSTDTFIDRTWRYTVAFGMTALLSILLWRNIPGFLQPLPNVNCQEPRKARRCKKWNLRENDDTFYDRYDTDKDQNMAPLFWTPKRKIEHRQKIAMIDSILGAALCWFLLDTVFLRLGFDVPQVTAQDWLLAIVPKIEPKSHNNNQAIPFEFGNARFGSIVAISWYLLVSIMLLNGALLKLKAWLAFFTLLILFDVFIEANFLLGDFSRLVLTTSGIVVAGVLGLRNWKRRTNLWAHFLAWIR
jgi:hypothetical protein